MTLITYPWIGWRVLLPVGQSQHELRSTSSFAALRLLVSSCFTFFLFSIHKKVVIISHCTIMRSLSKWTYWKKKVKYQWTMEKNTTRGLRILIDEPLFLEVSSDLWLVKCCNDLERYDLLHHNMKRIYLQKVF